MSRAAALPLAILAFFASPAGAAHKPLPPPTGEIVLDMDAPIIDAKISGVTFRLRVGLDQKNLVELNPDAAIRSGLPFEPGFEANVGRVTLPGIAATGQFDMGDRQIPVIVSSHGRDCCAGADGTISPALLPYAAIRFVRHATMDRGESRAYIMEGDDEHGLQVPVPVGPEQIYATFSLDRADSVASSSAGAILAKANAGRLTGMEATTVAAFGISRPTRTLSFGHPFTLAGFPFASLPVRIADFAGHYALPSIAPEPGDIVVKKRSRQQAAWPVVLIGRDRLDRCSEISYFTQTHALILRCDFAGSMP